MFSSKRMVAGHNLCNVAREGLVKKSVAASLLLSVFFFTSCSYPVRPSATSVSAVAPAATGTPTYSAPLPTNTVDVVAALLPEGQASAEWKGIPIMPNATAGEGDEEGYVFTIKATTGQVQDFYQAELGKLGWQPFGTSNADSSLMLMFTNSNSDTLTVSIIAKGDEVLVLLVK